MNRQIRRAQEKQDKRQEREKAKRRSQRRAKVERKRERKPAPEAPKAPANRRARVAGRFSGVLAGATVFFIVLQSLAPAPQPSVGDSLIGAAFYLMLGYFLTLWLMRRGSSQALLLSVISGGALAAGQAVAGLLLAEVGLDPLMLALALPGVALGSLLGRLVFVNSPA